MTVSSTYTYCQQVVVVNKCTSILLAISDPLCCNQTSNRWTADAKKMRAKSVNSGSARATPTIPKRSTFRMSRRLLQNKEWDSCQEYIRSLLADLEGNNIFSLTTAIRELTHLYLSGSHHSLFFARDVPIKIFVVALHNTQNARIFSLAQTFLRAFMESCASQSSYNLDNMSMQLAEYSKAKCLKSFLNYLSSQLNEEEMLYNIYFYMLVGEIIASPNACVAFAHTLAPIHFIQVYLQHVCSTLDMCSQTANTLSIKQLNQIQNTSSEEEASENSDLTMASSLSLDDDAAVYATCKHLDDTLSEISSARSILSNFAETAFGNDVASKKKSRKNTSSYARLPSAHQRQSADSDTAPAFLDGSPYTKPQLELDDSQIQSDASSCYSKSTELGTETDTHTAMNTEAPSTSDLGSDRTKDFDEEVFEDDSKKLLGAPSIFSIQDHSMNIQQLDNGSESEKTRVPSSINLGSIDIPAALDHNTSQSNTKGNILSEISNDSSTSLCTKDYSLALPVLADIIQDIPSQETKEHDFGGRPPATRTKKTRLPPQTQHQEQSQEMFSQQLSCEIGLFSNGALKEAIPQESTPSITVTNITSSIANDPATSSKDFHLSSQNKLLSFNEVTIPTLNLQQHQHTVSDQNKMHGEETSSPARQTLTTARRQSRYMIGAIHTGKMRPTMPNTLISNQPHNRANLLNAKPPVASAAESTMPPPASSGVTFAADDTQPARHLDLKIPRERSTEFPTFSQNSKSEKRASCGPLAQASKTPVNRPSIVPMLMLSKTVHWHDSTLEESKDVSNGDVSQTSQTSQMSQKKGMGLGLTLNLRSIRESESTAIPVSQRVFPARTDMEALSQNHNNNTNKAFPKPMNDFVFTKYLQILSERRKGITELSDTASRIGEYTFMRDYPLLCSLSSEKSYNYGPAASSERSAYTSLSVLTTSVSSAARVRYVTSNLYNLASYKEKVNEHKRRHLIHKLFSSAHVRDISDYQFKFSILSVELLYLVRLQRIDLSKEDVIRLGVSYILHQCLKYLSNIITKYLPNILPNICTDLIALHQRKKGFTPVVVLALSAIANQIHITTQSAIKCSWTKMMVKVYDYIDLTYDYIDLKTGEYIDDDDLHEYQQESKNAATAATERSQADNINTGGTLSLIKQVAKRHNVTLPDDMFVLQRLEAQRRMYCIDIYTLSLRLKTLVRIPHSISALDDIACYLAVIVDRLATSRSNPMVRGLVMTALLPSLLKIIELLQTNSIKSRLHYILIAQRILEVMSLLASDSFSTIPSLVVPPELPASRALVNGNMYFTTDQAMQNIDNMLCDVLLLDEANIPWLRRYSYLIFLNTRIKEELSGMYYNKQQCQHSFEVCKINFAKHIITTIRLLRQRFLKTAQQVSPDSRIDTTWMVTSAVQTNNPHGLLTSSTLVDSAESYTFKLALGSMNIPIHVTKYANLPENDYPKGKEDIVGYTYENKLKHLPLTPLVNLCTLEKHTNICSNMKLEHVALTRCDDSHRINVKEVLRDNDCHHVIGSLSFLFDFETGVFPQYLMLVKNDLGIPKQPETLLSPKQAGSVQEADLFKVIPTAETVAEARTQHTAAKELLTELSGRTIPEPTRRKSALFVLYALAEFFTLENVDLYIKPTDIRKFISFHYNSFLKLYNDCEVDLIECIMNNNSSVSLLDLCNGHLNVLSSLIKMNSPNIRQYFYELRIMHFLILQLSVEDKSNEMTWQKTVQEHDTATLQQINMARAKANKEWAKDVASKLKSVSSTLSLATTPDLPPASLSTEKTEKKPAILSLSLPLNVKNIAQSKESTQNATHNAAEQQPNTRPCSTSTKNPPIPPKLDLQPASQKLPKLALATSSTIVDNQTFSSITTMESNDIKQRSIPQLRLGKSNSSVLTPGLDMRTLTDETSSDLSADPDIIDPITNHGHISKKITRFTDVIAQDTLLSVDASFDYPATSNTYALKLPSVALDMVSLTHKGFTDDQSSAKGSSHPLVNNITVKRKAQLYDSSDSDSCWEAEAKRLNIDIPTKKAEKQRIEEAIPPVHSVSYELEADTIDQVTPESTSKSGLTNNNNNTGFKLNLAGIEKHDDRRESVVAEQQFQSIAGGISQFEAAANILNPKFHLLLGNKIAADLETAHATNLISETVKNQDDLQPNEQEVPASKPTTQKGKQRKNPKSVLKKEKFYSTSTGSLAPNSLAATTNPVLPDKSERKTLMRSATTTKITGQMHQQVDTSDLQDSNPLAQSVTGLPKIALSTTGTFDYTVTESQGQGYETSAASETGVSDVCVYPQNIASLGKVFQKPLYLHEELHYTILYMILQLVIVPETGALDPMYSSQFPANDGMINVLWILHHHLNHPINEKLALRLISSDISPAARRLLRLTCYNLFDATLYPIKNKNRFTLLAQGAFGSVYAGNVALVTEQNRKCQSFLTPVAVKIQEESKSLYDRCVLHDIFNEITVMEKLANYSGISRMYDYGVTHDGYYIIMHRYTTSLKDLRLKLFDDPDDTQNSQLLYHPQPQYKRLPIYGHEMSYMRYVRIYLLIFIQFLRHLNYLHTNGVNHYDIKADNVFFDPRTANWYLLMAKYNKNAKEGELINIDTPLSKDFLNAFFDAHKTISSYELLPFKIAIADFGESMIFSDEESSYTIINKGTEYNKSPEMLLSANMVAQTRSNFDRRRPKGAGSSSDVWSAACFLYELLTGDILFFDSDWIRFFIRVTKDSYQSHLRTRARDKSAAASFTFNRPEKFGQLYRGVSLSPEKKAMLGNCQPIIDLLEFCLVPNPTLRPQIRDVIVMTEHILVVYFPPTYTYKAERYYVEPVPDTPFISSNFCYTIIGGVDECIANPGEVLAPKLSVVKQNDDTQAVSMIPRAPSNQERLGTEPSAACNIVHVGVQTVECSEIEVAKSSTSYVHFLPPITNIMDGFVWIGSSGAFSHIETLLLHNIISVIDCLTQSLELSTAIKRQLELTNIHYFKLPSILLQIVKQNAYKGSGAAQTQPNSLQLSKEGFMEYYKALEDVLDFVRSTVTHGGRCLIYDEDGLGLSAAVSIAMLVEFRSLSLFTALLHVKHLRPYIAPPLHFMDFLHYWSVFRIKPGIRHKDLLYASSTSFKRMQIKATPSYEQLLNMRISKARYQCLCGKVFFIIKPDVKQLPYLVLCNCAYTPNIAVHNNRGINANSSCPTHSCRSILNLMMSIHGIRLNRILWAFVYAQDVLSNYKKATTSIYKIPSVPYSIECSMESLQHSGFTGLDDMRAPMARIPMQQHWELHYCKICGMITHAVDSRQPSDLRLAILANLSPK